MEQTINIIIRRSNIYVDDQTLTYQLPVSQRWDVPPYITSPGQLSRPSELRY